MNKKIPLGSKALQNAIMFKWTPKFTFIFKDKKGNLIDKYTLDALHACIISTKVYEAYSCDPTISEYAFVADGFSKNHITQYFGNIFNGLIIDASLIQPFLNIANAIGTEDVIDEIMKIIKAETPMESNNIISKIILKINSKANYDEEIRYASQNLTKLIEENVFNECPEDDKIDILTSILSIYEQQEPKERDIEIVFDYIDTFENDNFIRLVSLLNPKFMNSELMSRVLSRVKKEDVTDDFLAFIYKRFISPDQKVAKSVIKCDYSTSLNGIFSELTSRNGKNPCENNDIRITFSGNLTSKSPIQNIIEYKSKSSGCIICAKNDEYPRIEFDFGDNKKINLSGYELKVKGEQSSYNFPKTWQILGSNNRLNYDIINTKENANDFTPGKSKYYRVPKQGKSYRYIVYCQKENHGTATQQKYLRLAAIEFYGEIIYN